MSTLESARRSAVLFFGGLFALLFGGLMLWLLLADLVLHRHVVEIEVLDAELPLHCHEAWTSTILSALAVRRIEIVEAHRDFEPFGSIGDFCGVVRTSRGWMKLPHSRIVWPATDKRERLLHRLRPGCRYRVVIVDHFSGGRALDPNRGTNRPPEIRSIREAYPCTS